MRRPHPVLESQLAHLGELDDRSDLLQLWALHFDNIQPPRNISNGLLRRAIAYRLQEKAYGGLKASTRRYLESVVTAEQDNRSIKPAEAKVEPGTRLVREWHGRAYEVLVLQDQVQMNGRLYNSLSEVAEVITGVHWSGPRFFGLTSVTSSQEA